MALLNQTYMIDFNKHFAVQEWLTVENEVVAVVEAVVVAKIAFSQTKLAPTLAVWLMGHSQIEAEVITFKLLINPTFDRQMKSQL